MGARQDLNDPRLKNPMISGGFKIAVGPTVSATGSTQGTARELRSGLTLVDDANGTRGVKLPAGTEDGEVFIVKNLVATTGNTLAIYPPTGGVINALSANAAFTLGLASGIMIVRTGNGLWQTIPL